FYGVIKLLGTVALVGTGNKDSGEARARRRPLILGRNNIIEGSAVRNQVDIFLIRLPANSALVKQTRKMQLIVLVLDRQGARQGRERIAIVEYAKVGPGFCPDVVGFGWMNVGVAPRCSQNITIVVGKGHLLADIDL